MPISGVNFSGAMANASSAISTTSRASASSASSRRCSLMARASGIERKLAPLLDDGAGEQVGERALRQPELVRRAGALVVGLVAGDERHRHLGAGPGMVAQVLGGLADAVLDPRLRQRQRHFG